MSLQAIIRDRESAFAELVRKPEDLRRAAATFIQVISDSFAQDQARSLLTVLKTESELMRRFKICEEWFRVMRGDCGYSCDKALDFLAVALRSTLDGIAFEPPKKDASWSPDALAQKMSNNV
jgi:hypothetical protein